jgi:uncharacterized protein HemY
MIKKFFLSVILIAILVYALVLLYQQPGDIVLQLKNSSTAFPIGFVLIGLELLAILLILLWHGLTILFALPRKIKDHFDQNRALKKQTLLDAGLRAWMARDWVTVEKQFKALNYSGWSPELAEQVSAHAKAQKTS